MTDDIQGSGSRPPIMSRRNRRRSAFPPIVLLGVVAILVAVVGGGWFWLRSREAPEPEPTALTDSVAPPVAEEEPFVLPPLDASDAAVRTLAAELSSHPWLAEWLVTDDLIRRFVEAVVDISRGSSPLPSLEMLIPDEPFTVERSGDRLVTNPESYRRYDLLGDVFASLDAEDAAELYRRLSPLFLEAYRELGIPDVAWEEVLAGAVGNMLAVEVPSSPPELREAVGRYVYVDRELESLSPAEKHLLRFGPENAERIQGKLREIAQELEIIPPAPSHP